MIAGWTQALQDTVTAILRKHQLDYDIEWHLSGNPFLTPGGTLVDATLESVREVTQQDAELSTTGGTSDGRFIAPTGTQVVELGLLNATIHKVNECTPVADLDTLSALYQRIMTKLLT